MTDVKMQVVSDDGTIRVVACCAKCGGTLVSAERLVVDGAIALKIAPHECPPDRRCRRCNGDGAVGWDERICMRCGGSGRDPEP